jgi:hypothetical protein
VLVAAGEAVVTMDVANDVICTHASQLARILRNFALPQSGIVRDLIAWVLLDEPPRRPDRASASADGQAF